MGRDGFSPERTSFVGRGAELAALDACVAEGARIVTLAGPPGAGKTRLARRFGRRALDASAFDAGFFVELAEARTAEEAIDAIASTLEIPVDRASSTDAAIDVLGAAVDARGRVLVVLDNAEQIVEVVAAIVGGLVDRAPQLRVIVTSRDRLRVEGESVIEVEPLDEGDARALFLDRAHAVAPSWTPDDDDRRAIDELLRRLDRLPLAIELAAGRAHVLRPAALLARLGDRLHALSTHRRDVLARQASLAAAIDASWTLLSDWERAALSQISVFAGGIDVEGAEAVLDLTAFSDAPPIPDALAALVDRSLARADENARVSLYEMIRSYAREKLGDARVPVEDRHARWIVDLAERSASRIDRLAFEQRNLDAAYRAERDRDPRLAARAVLALEPLVHRRGAHAAFVARIDDLLGTTEITADPRSTATLLRARAEARRVHGEVNEAILDLRRARALAVEAKDDLLEARVVRVLAPLDAGDDAGPELERARSIALACDDRALAGEISARLGLLAFDRGEADAARAHYERALVDARAAKSAWLEAVVSTTLGTLAVTEHRFDDARASLERAVALHRSLGDRRQEGAALEHLVGLHHERGDLDEAWRCVEEALRLHKEVGDRLFEGAARLAMGMQLLERSRHDDAAANLREAIAIFDDLGDARYAAVARAWLGVVALDRGRADVDDRDEARRRLDDAATAAQRAQDRHAEASARAWLALAVDGPSSKVHLDAARAVVGDRPRAAMRELFESIENHLENQPIRAPRSLEARIAARIVGRSDGRMPRGPTNVAARALVVGDGGRWFVLDGGERVDLTRRRSLRLLLARLADERVAAPGRPLSLDALLSAGWPGERVQPAAGASRVYVAVRTLRRLGLEPLLTSGDGYLLDPDVPLSRA